MKQASMWVATFDDAECRVFSFNGNPRRLEEIVGERREGPRKNEFDDRPGRVHASVGARRSSMAPRTDPARRLEAAFVTALAEHLAVKAQEGAFDQLIVAAAPRALGAFRAVASKPLAVKLVRELSGDYVKAGETRLQQALER